MRRVTSDICTAFEKGEAKSNGNTYTDGNSLFLHGNKIAWWSEEGNLWIDSCRWNTNTTRDRLNGLHGVRVSTKLCQMYLNGEKWDGEAIEVKGVKA